MGDRAHEFSPVPSWDEEANEEAARYEAHAEAWYDYHYNGGPSPLATGEAND